MSRPRPATFESGADGPLVSIITATHNHERFIRQCVESVLAQSYDRWEQIIVDDGSLDGTRAIISAFSDRRIRYVHQPNSGIQHLSETYNKALDIARVDLIAVLEGDDYWPVDKLERQVQAFADPDVAVSWGMAGEVSETGALIRVWPDPPLPNLSGNQGGLRTIRRLLAGNYLPACTVMCRTTELRAVGGFAQPSGVPIVDYPTWLRLACRGRVVALEKVLGYWRRHPSQVTVTMQAEMSAIPRYGWAAWLARWLSDGERRALRLMPGDASRIDEDRRAAIAFHYGRLAQRANKRQEARELFANAARRGRGKIRAKALLAIASAAAGIEVDSLVSIRDKGRSYLPSKRPRSGSG